jgi:hypothetical protein
MIVSEINVQNNLSYYVIKRVVYFCVIAILQKLQK